MTSRDFVSSASQARLAVMGPCAAKELYHAGQQAIGAGTHVPGLDHQAHRVNSDHRSHPLNRTREPPPTPRSNESWRHLHRAALRCGCLPTRKTQPRAFEQRQQRNLALIVAPAPAQSPAWSSRAAASYSGAPHPCSTRIVARSRRPAPEAGCTFATPSP